MLQSAWTSPQTYSVPKSSDRLSSVAGCPSTSSVRCSARSSATRNSTRRSPTRCAAAMKDWALEHGATYTPYVEPFTGLTAEKHESVLRPDRRRHRDRRVLRGRADPGRARRVELSDRRRTRHLRGPGLHGLGPDEPAPSYWKTRTAACCASRPRSRRGPGRPSTTRSPCCGRSRRSTSPRCALWGCSATTARLACTRRWARSRNTS